MAYTPELSQRHSGTLRRIAWALGMPMTKTLEGLLEYIVTTVKTRKVCDACRDKSFCRECPFNNTTEVS